MIRGIIVCVALTLTALGGILHAQTPSWEWGVQAGGTSSERGAKIVPDGEGGVYVLGTFAGKAIFDQDTITSYGKIDVFLARYSPLGECMWATPMGSVEDDAVGGIAVSSDGHVHVSGTFTGTVNFPKEFPGMHVTIQIHSDGGDDFFTAEYAPNGDCLTTSSRRGVGTDVPHGLAADTRGNVYMIGSFTNTMEFARGSITSKGKTDVFLARLSSEPDSMWLRRAGGKLDDVGTSIAVDGAGRIYLTASFDGTVTFDNMTISVLSDHGIAIACYNPNGSIEWLMARDATNLRTPCLLAASPDGNFYITAAFRDSIKISASTFTSQGEEDVCLIAYDSEGKLRWVRQIGGSLSQSPSDIATDATGNVYVTGISQNLADGSVFVSKYASDGTQQWLRNETRQGTDQGSASSGGVCADAQGNVYVTGGFSGRIGFGTTTLASIGSTATSTAGSDVFIAKLNSTSGVAPTTTAHGIRILGNAPNPSTDATTLRFELEKPAEVRLRVSDIQGRVVQTIERGRMAEGSHTIRLNTADLPQGYYLLQYHVDGTVVTQPITVTR